jgi:hypothetical protein
MYAACNFGCRRLRHMGTKPYAKAGAVPAPIPSPIIALPIPYQSIALPLS